MPLSFEALMRAIELNGAAIEMNKTAFAWGRLAALDLPAVLEAAGIVRNAPVAERRRTSCRCCRRASGKATSGAPTSRRSRTRRKTSCATCPAHGGGDVAFLPLDDARLSRSLDEVVARRVDVPHRLPGRRRTPSATRDFVAQGARRRSSSARRAAPT